MTWVLWAWLGASVAWALGFVTAALLACRRTLTVPEAVEHLAAAMARECIRHVCLEATPNGDAFAAALAAQLEQETWGSHPRNDEAEPRGASVPPERRQ